MASAEARAYNGGLGAESPTAVQGAGGQSPMKLTDTGKVFVFKAVILDGSAAILHEMMYYLYFLHLT